MSQEEQDKSPEAMEEAGVLEADVGARFDYQLSNIDPRLKIDMDPLAHRDLRPEMMFIRDELRQAKFQALAVPTVENMAANMMMNTLRKIQRDLTEQKDYVRNLHVVYTNINEKFNLMEAKLEQNHVTMVKLEQQVRKNNTLLFGNDEMAINFEAGIDENNISFDETIASNENLEAVQLSPQMNKQIDQLNSELKEIKEAYQVQMSEIKELIKELAATTKTSKDDVSEVKHQETVQISPAYFSTDQIMKLNMELKQITDKYATNGCPNIEVVPNTSPSDDHPVLKALSAGVYFDARDDISERYGIKLGTKGFKRKEIRDLLTEYPDLTLHDVVREVLKSNNEWNDLSKKYDFTCSHSVPNMRKVVPKLETVSLPSYLPEDIIKELNCELKQITEKYQETNIFPNIQVVPNNPSNNFVV